MIKANELRVGNFVYWEDDKLVHEIRSVSKDKIHPIELIELDGNVNWAHSCMLDDLFPIPLIDEWLTKIGFVLQPKKISIYIKGRLKLWLGHNGAIAYLKNNDTDESYFIPHNPQSLHQLQNLYFALAGEELTINL